MAATPYVARRRMGAREITPPARLREPARDPWQANRRRALPRPRWLPPPGGKTPGSCRGRIQEEQSAQPGGACSHRARFVRALDKGGPYGCRADGGPGWGMAAFSLVRWGAWRSLLSSATGRDSGTVLYLAGGAVALYLV